jgi:ferredoxin-fold anticodon binding domain-containing protein
MKILIFGYGNRVKSDILFAIDQAINKPDIIIVTKNSKPNKLKSNNLKFYTFSEFKKLEREYFDLKF